MIEPDPIDQAAKEMAEGLHELPPHSQQAFRYLFARVALDAGLLGMVGHEIRPTGERLICREVETGKLYAVDRPAEWTIDEEEQYVAEMRKRFGL